MHGCYYAVRRLGSLLSVLDHCDANHGYSNWCVMAFTYVRFYSAMKVQNIDRKEFLPVYSKFQPFAGYWALCWACLFIWLQGYSVFLKGNWNVATFIFNYGIVSIPHVRNMLLVPVLTTLAVLVDCFGWGDRIVFQNIRTDAFP